MKGPRANPVDAEISKLGQSKGRSIMVPQAAMAELGFKPGSPFSHSLFYLSQQWLWSFFWRGFEKCGENYHNQALQYACFLQAQISFPKIELKRLPIQSSVLLPACGMITRWGFSHMTPTQTFNISCMTPKMTLCLFWAVDSFNFYTFKVTANSVLFQYQFYCMTYSLWLFHLFHWDVGMANGTFKRFLNDKWRISNTKLWWVVTFETPRSHFIVMNFVPGIIGQISISMCSVRGSL